MTTAGIRDTAITAGIRDGITIGMVAGIITGIRVATTVGTAVPIGIRDMAGTMDSITDLTGDAIMTGMAEIITTGTTE
jgi:hypothetical protein